MTCRIAAPILAAAVALLGLTASPAQAVYGNHSYIVQDCDFDDRPLYKQNNMLQPYRGWELRWTQGNNIASGGGGQNSNNSAAPHAYMGVRCEVPTPAAAPNDTFGLQDTTPDTADGEGDPTPPAGRYRPRGLQLRTELCDRRTDAICVDSFRDTNGTQIQTTLTPPAGTAFGRWTYQFGSRADLYSPLESNRSGHPDGGNYGTRYQWATKLLWGNGNVGSGRTVCPIRSRNDNGTPCGGFPNSSTPTSGTETASFAAFGNATFIGAQLACTPITVSASCAWGPSQGVPYGARMSIYVSNAEVIDNADPVLSLQSTSSDSARLPLWASSTERANRVMLRQSATDNVGIGQWVEHVDILQEGGPGSTEFTNFVQPNFSGSGAPSGSPACTDSYTYNDIGNAAYGSTGDFTGTGIVGGLRFHNTLRPCSQFNGQTTEFPVDLCGVSGAQTGRTARVSVWAYDPAWRIAAHSKEVGLDCDTRPREPGCPREHGVADPLPGPQAGSGLGPGQVWFRGAKAVRGFMCAYSGVQSGRIQYRLDAGQWRDLPGCSGTWDPNTNRPQGTDVDPNAGVSLDCTFNSTLGTTGQNIDFRVTYQDGAGNGTADSDPSLSPDFIDNEPPSVGAIQIEGQAPAAANLSVNGWTNARQVIARWPTVNRGSGAPITSVQHQLTSDCGTTTSTDQPGTTSRTINHSAQACEEGQHTVRVRASDLADPNDYGAWTSRTYGYDSIPPAIPGGLVPTPDEIRDINDFTVTYRNDTWDGIKQSPIVMRRFRIAESPVSQSPSTCASGAQCTLSGLTIPNPDGSNDPPPSGDYPLKLWLTDEAGNQTESNAALTVLRFINLLCQRD